MRMDKEEFIKTNNIEDGTIILEPFEIFSKGIIGINSERNKLYYSYEALAEALAEDYRKEYEESDKTYDEPDFLFEAYEWIDYNTIRSLDYMGENKPIIVYGVIL